MNQSVESDLEAVEGPNIINDSPFSDFDTDLIAKERYTSAEFMQAEWDHMWTKVWLVGGLSQDIPEAGDYIVTEIGKESILIVRQEDGSVRAFYNVCLHRGNRLRPTGIGKAESFVCAYHHWEYGYDGSIAKIPDTETFRQGVPCAGLKEVACAEWGIWVWFNLNPQAEPLMDYLNVIPSHLDPYHFERMVLVKDFTIEWDCNWKASVDAFNESYHVQGIHRQLLWYLDDYNLKIQLFDKHNAYFIKFLTLSKRVNQNPPEIPPPFKHEMKKAGMDPASYSGSVHDIRRAVQVHKRATAAERGFDFSELTDEQLTDDFHYMIFPNITLNCHSDDLWVFRQRPHPTDPNKMFFDFQNFELMTPEQRAEWDEKHPERVRHDHFKHGEKSAGLVINQDAFNLLRVQHGMQSEGFQGLWIGEQELRIRHMHRTLDFYINGK
jgi:phenylpropionate dioxygenase-like ring-hydroxylating dioxygenase large terminal subunit